MKKREKPPAPPLIDPDPAISPISDGPCSTETGEQARQRRMKQQAETGTWEMTPEEIRSREEWLNRMFEEMRRNHSTGKPPAETP